MEIHHKLKPLHGWREFLGEVGIIVLGVILALGAEQVAEAVHWHERVKAGREALEQDFATILFETHERELYSRCLSARLQAIADIIDTASTTGRLPPVGELGSPPRRPWRITSWSSLTEAQTAAHLPRDELTAYSGIADFALEIEQANDSEMDSWVTLYTIVGPGRAFREAEANSLRIALSKAQNDARTMRLTTHQLTRMIRDSGLSLTAEDARQLPGEIAGAKQRIARSSLCQPIGKAPPRYGAAPFQSSLDGPLPD